MTRRAPFAVPADKLVGETETEYLARKNGAPVNLGPDEYIGKAKINGFWYTGKHMIRVAKITYDGTTCTVPLSTLIDILGEDVSYQVCVTSMRKAEFDRLEEFQGW